MGMSCSVRLIPSLVDKSRKLLSILWDTVHECHIRTGLQTIIPEFRAITSLLHSSSEIIKYSSFIS